MLEQILLLIQYKSDITVYSTLISITAVNSVILIVNCQDIIPRIILFTITYHLMLDLISLVVNGYQILIIGVYFTCEP